MINKISDWLESTLQLKNSDKDEEHTTQLAAAVLLLEVSRADFDIAEKEKQTIAEILITQFKLQQEEAAALLRYVITEHEQYTSAHPFIRLLNEELSQIAKRRLLAGLWKVAFADGILDKYEEYHIRKIADWLYLSHADFIRIKHQVMQELDIPH